MTLLLSSPRSGDELTSMKEQLEKDLQQIGLSEKEAKVYLASLELGPSTAQTIAAKATVNRPTTYVMIESLIKRGLMSSFQKGKKRFFSASSPRQMGYIIQQEKNELKRKEQIIEDISKQLSSVIDPKSSMPTVQVFEGIAGIQAAQSDILQTAANELFELTSMDESRQILPLIYENDIRRKILDKYKIKSLYSSKLGSTEVKHKNVDSRMLSDKQKVACDVIIYGTKVLLISYDGSASCVLLNGQKIATTFKTLFLSLWENAK